MKERQSGSVKDGGGWNNWQQSSSPCDAGPWAKRFLPCMQPFGVVEKKKRWISRQAVAGTYLYLRYRISAEKVPTLKPLTVTAKRLQGHSPAYRVNSRLEEAARLVSAIHLLRSHSTAAPCRVFGWYGLVSALQVRLDMIAV